MAECPFRYKVSDKMFLEVCAARTQGGLGG